MKKIYKYIKESELNSYEKQEKRLSYRHLFYKDENLLLCNDIAKDFEYFDLYSGNGYDEESERCGEVYQYYLIDENTADRLAELDEIIYYDNRLDVYILGVTHFGTSWDCVLTDVTIEKNKNNDIYTCYYEKSEE